MSRRGKLLCGESAAHPRRLLSLALVLVLLPLLAFAQAQPGGRYYPETGHTLAPEFIDFFDANGGVNIFGYPITDGFHDPGTGIFIQYTENARMEWDWERNRVVLQPLGELLGGWHLPEEDPRAEGSGCRYFEESGHATCFAFLAFYERHGGEELFGLPISDFLFQNDRIVQYFEYFRLDWYPEAVSEGQVRVAPLGREHFRRENYDPELLRPTNRGDEGEYRVTALRPSASVLHPTLPADDEQQVYLVVRDQNQLPVKEAAALLIGHFPGRDRYFVMPPTDQDGVTRRDLSLAGVASGAKINLEIWVMYAGLEAVSRDSFTVR